MLVAAGVQPLDESAVRRVLYEIDRLKAIHQLCKVGVGVAWDSWCTAF